MRFRAACGPAARRPGGTRPCAVPLLGRRILPLALAACALALIPGFAVAGAARSVTRPFRAVAQEVDIHAIGVPAAGSHALAAAALTATPGGDGALVSHLDFTGATGAPATFGLTVRATAFFATGTMNLALTGTLTVGTGSRLTFAARGRITGGTGAYAKARGPITLSGTAPNATAGHVDTLQISGRITA